MKWYLETATGMWHRGWHFGSDCVPEFLVRALCGLGFTSGKSAPDGPSPNEDGKRTCGMCS